MTEETNNPGSDWDVSKIHDLRKAEEKVYANAAFWFSRESLAGCRVHHFLSDMRGIGERRMWRALYLGIVIGCILGAAIIHLTDCVFR